MYLDSYSTYLCIKQDVQGKEIFDDLDVIMQMPEI
jgi:hypothetical protein